MAKQLELDLGRPAWHETNYGYALERDTSLTSSTTIDRSDLHTKIQESRKEWLEQLIEQESQKNGD